jgi:tRNA A37 threonylcarbamoyladenosine dehydratase
MKEHYNLLAKNKQLLPMEYIRTPEEIWDNLSQEFDFTVDACASDKII